MEVRDVRTTHQPGTPAVSTARYLRMQQLAEQIAATTDDEEAWSLYNEADRERHAQNHENPLLATKWFHLATVAYRGRFLVAVSS